jgi:hypothetical protein
MKEREAAGQEEIPHHRTRSIWYWGNQKLWSLRKHVLRTNYSCHCELVKWSGLSS